MLPTLSPDMDVATIGTTLRMVKKRLGEAGREAMAKYIDGCGLSDRSVLMATLLEVFGEVADKDTKGRGRRGQTSSAPGHGH